VGGFAAHAFQPAVDQPVTLFIRDVNAWAGDLPTLPQTNT
jgi:hypothetical protein